MDTSSDNDTPADDLETPARGSSVEPTRSGTGTGSCLTTEPRDGRRLVHLDVVALDGLL